MIQRQTKVTSNGKAVADCLYLELRHSAVTSGALIIFSKLPSKALAAMMIAVSAVPIFALSIASAVSAKPVLAESSSNSASHVTGLAPFNNGVPANGVTWFGATLGNGKNDSSGWPGTSEIQGMIDLGAKTIRLPINPQYCVTTDGRLNPWVVKKLADDIELAIAKRRSIVLDAHTYLPFTDPHIASFWSLLAPAIEKRIGGPSPFFGIELANEPGRGSKDLSAWTNPLRGTIAAIRNAGYRGYIFAGAGDWNNATFLDKALATIGSPTVMDPLNRTIYTMHDYWNEDSNPGKTRNDQGAAVNGTINFFRRYDPALNAARKLGVKVVMSEIGGGISPTGPLPAFNGVGKNGKQLEEEYFAYAKANRDVLLGTWFWAAGKMSAGYRHKVEAGNLHTKELQGFW